MGALVIRDVTDSVTSCVKTVEKGLLVINLDIHSYLRVS